jgi:glucose/mannose-6-phosphate isomerase
MPLIAFLQGLGFGEKTGEVEEMFGVLDKLVEELKETVPAATNKAKQLAVRLQGKIAVIYGAGTLADVARRWKTQINENSKAWAFHEVFPELNHNAVVGYSFPGELDSKMFVVMLRSPSLHNRILLRYQVTGEMLQQNGISYGVMDAQGESPLSQMMSLVVLGDWASYYLAMLYGSDPTPVKSIDYLKKRLSES